MKVQTAAPKWAAGSSNKSLHLLYADPKHLIIARYGDCPWLTAGFIQADAEGTTGSPAEGPHWGRTDTDAFFSSAVDVRLSNVSPMNWTIVARLPSAATLPVRCSVLPYVCACFGFAQTWFRFELLCCLLESRDWRRRTASPPLCPFCQWLSGLISFECLGSLSD